MDPNTIQTRLQRELAATQHFASLGRTHVETQRHVILRLKRNGQDAANATELLKTLERAQAIHDDAVRRLEQELAAFQRDRAEVEQSRSELRRRIRAQPGTYLMIASGARAVATSIELLDSLSGKP